MKILGDASLPITVVKSGYMSYHSPPVSLNLSGHSPVTCLINMAFLPKEPVLAGCFCILLHSVQTIETTACDNWQFLKYSNQTGTNIHTKNTANTFFSILIFDMNITQSSSPVSAWMYTLCFLHERAGVQVFYYNDCIYTFTWAFDYMGQCIHT